MAKPRRFGELLIDHTFSPGLTPEMVLAAGLDPRSVPAVGADKKGEFATVTCCHCNTIVILNPERTRARGYCPKCDAYCCDCHGCSPEFCNGGFDKLLDFVQEQNAKMVDRGLIVDRLPDLTPLYASMSASVPESPPK
jgi:hypothetical protein